MFHPMFSSMLQWKIRRAKEVIQHHEKMIDIYTKQIQHKMDKMSSTHLYMERAKRELEELEALKIHQRELGATQPIT